MRYLFTAFLFCGVLALRAQDSAPDSLGLPGDDFDLYGATELFKQASSLEDFEKKINDPKNEINNLDLDGDGNVDYVRVVDNMDGDAHAIVLQVEVSETETQDVAAIEVEKSGTDNANMQIVGDEELYGANYIVEPEGDEQPAQTQQKWSGEQNFMPVHVVVNVWMWPCVRFIYAPAYVVWVSPYHWHRYPAWWAPWHPVAWHVYHAHVIHYHAHYCYCHERRMARAHAAYVGHRHTSAVVRQRNEARRAPGGGQGQRSPAPGGRKAGGQQKGGGQQRGGHQGGQKAPRGGGGAKHGDGGGGGHGGGGRR